MPWRGGEAWGDTGTGHDRPDAVACHKAACHAEVAVPGMPTLLGGIAGPGNTNPDPFWRRWAKHKTRIRVSAMLRQLCLGRICFE